MVKKARIISYNKLSVNAFPSKKKVLVGGCFDVLHIGHIRFLEAAKKAGQYVIVAVESDEFIEKHKNRKPFHSQEERAEIISSLRCVDAVIILPFFNSNKEYNRLVELVKPECIAVTDGDMQLENKKRQAKSVGGKVKIVISHQNNISSTELLEFYAKDQN